MKINLKKNGIDKKKIEKMIEEHEFDKRVTAENR